MDHASVTATLEDWYGADYVDHLDELKTNTDERLVVANAGAYALGRKVDEIIVARLDQTANVVAEAGTGLNKAKVLQAFGLLNANDVPDDGNRFAVVGAHQWNELLDISEFKSADFAGDRYPWLKGTESRTWLGITWMFHTGLPLVSGTRKCFLYHRSAVGLAESQEVKVFTDWVPEKAAHLVDHMPSRKASRSASVRCTPRPTLLPVRTAWSRCAKDSTRCLWCRMMWPLYSGAPRTRYAAEVPFRA